MVSIVVAWLILRWFRLDIVTMKGAVMGNTIPIGNKLFIRNDKGKPERNQIISYHLPVGDTVLIPHQGIDYYDMVRRRGWNKVQMQYKKKYVSLNKMDKRIGRCVALPDDDVEIKD